MASDSPDTLTHAILRYVYSVAAPTISYAAEGCAQGVMSANVVSLTSEAALLV